MTDKEILEIALKSGITLNRLIHSSVVNHDIILEFARNILEERQ